MKTAKNEREWKRKESHNQRAVRQAVEANKHKKAIYDKFSDIYKKCVEDQSNKLAEYARQDCLADLIIRMHAENQNSLMEINYASGATTYNNMYELNRDFGYER